MIFDDSASSADDDAMMPVQSWAIRRRIYAIVIYGYKVAAATLSPRPARRACYHHLLDDGPVYVLRRAAIIRRDVSPMISLARISFSFYPPQCACAHERERREKRF